MKPGTSAFLNAARFVAALAVFVTHLMLLVPGAQVDAVMHLGSEAVAVFFVLSGFVIAYVTDTTERGWRPYAINRMARIYSVAIPAIVITLIIDAIGRRIAPDVDTLFWGHTGLGQVGRAAAALLFINEIWDRHIIPGSNVPWWSLGAEVPYYFAFGIAWFAPGRWRWLAIPFLSLFPRMALLAPMWIFGFILYYVPLGRVRGTHLLTTSTIVYVAFEIARARFGWGGTEALFQPSWSLWPYFVVAAVFGMAVVGSRELDRFPAANLWSWLSSRTFTLYLVHYPVAQLATRLLPPSMTPWMRFAIAGTATLLAVGLSGELGELRKRQWRRIFDRLLRGGTPDRTPAGTCTGDPAPPRSRASSAV